VITCDKGVGIGLTTHLHLVEGLKIIRYISQPPYSRRGLEQGRYYTFPFTGKISFAQHISNVEHFSGRVNNMMLITPICEIGHLFCLEICGRHSTFEIAAPAIQCVPHY